MQNIILGAVALGILWSVMTLGVYISFRILDAADMTAEGSIVSGAATSAVLIFNGVNPIAATIAAMCVGMLAGLLTSVFHLKLKIPALLSGILSMIMLYSINIRIMGKTSNVSLLRKNTIFTYFANFGFSKHISAIMGGLIVVAIVIAGMYLFFNTAIGFAVRATGNNKAMAKAQGINTNFTTGLGLVLSNGLIGLGGGLIAQYLGFADIQMGTGSIVIGLASLIIGEVLFAGKGGFVRTLVSVVVGAVSYRIIIAFVFEAGMPATDLKMFTALTVAFALCIPQIKAFVKKLKPGAEVQNAKNKWAV